MKRLMNRIKSDEAAAMSGEMLMLIALAVFAGLALFKYVLTPIQKSAQLTGNTIQTTIANLLSGKGNKIPDLQP